MKLNLLINILLISSMLFACNSNFNTDEQCDPNTDPFGSEPYGGLKSHSDCKINGGVIQTGISSSDECIYYQYFPEYKILYLAHKNAALNCEPGKITSKIIIKDNTINIIEYQEQSSARCNCLYDIDYELRNIKAGIYLVTISGPIIDGEHNPSLSFYINIEESLVETYCTKRGFYPWIE